MHQGIEQQLNRLQQKLQQLMLQYKQLQLENSQLKKALAKKEEALQVNTTSLTIPDKEALQKQIDIYLQEIDRCLLLINAAN